MRPDAHKQKASRRYQAAHDMTSSAGRGGSAAKRGRGSTTAARRTQQQDTAGQANDTEANPFSEELESDRSKASAFWTRRRVVDNSFRFQGELPSASDEDDGDENVDEQVKDAGAKAAKVLAERIARTEQRSRTDAAAFKFKDEEAWDQVRESQGGADSDLGAVVTLDLSQLDAAVASVPLATRLPAVATFVPSVAASIMTNEPTAVSPSRPKSRSRSRTRQPPAPAQNAPNRQPSQPPKSASTKPGKQSTSPAATSDLSTQPTPSVAPAATKVKPAEGSKVASMEAWLDDFLDD